jgi:mannosyltransferase
LILFLLVLLAFGLRVYHLDYQSLWRDETDAILFARWGLSELWTLFVRPGHNGPLYFVILHGWIRLFGDNEFAVRLLSLLAGVLSVPLVYLLGRRWLSTKASVVATLLAATSPYLIWYGQEGKMYALLFLLSALATYVYLLALERNRLYLWGCYVVLVAASMYVHLLAVLILPFHFLLFWAAWPRYRRAWRGWLASFAVLALPYVPLVRWEVALLLRPFTTGHQFYPLHQMLTILLTSFSLSAAPGQNVLAMALFVFLLLAGLLLPLHRAKEGGTQFDGERGGGRRDRLILALYLFVPAISLFAISLKMPIFADRYLITIMPAFLLLLGRGVVAVRERSAALGAACLGLALVCNLYVVTVQDQTPIKSDFRAVAQYVEQDGRGDLVLFLIPQVKPVFQYYDDERLALADAPYTNGGMGLDEVTEYMGEVTQGHQQVWLILSEGELWDSRGLTREWLDSHGLLLDRQALARVDVYLYSLVGPSAVGSEAC